MLRWVGRIAGVFFGLLFVIGAIIGTKYFMMKDPARKRVNDTILATGELRRQLGRDAHIKMRQLEDDGTDDDLELTVTYAASTPQSERKDLYGSTNIIVRQHVPHVRTVRVVFGEELTPELPAALDDGGTAVPQPVPPPQKPPLDPVEPPKKATAAPAKKGPTGTITLAILPEAKVFKGAQALGTTPLFNVELPVGTHLLTVIGADGSRHSLSVRIKQGKNAPMKVDLADLPKSR